MAFNISNINGGNILLNDTIITSKGGNLIVIANDPKVFSNINVASQSYNIYYYTGETITINNTGTYYINDNSVYYTGPTGYTGYQGPIGFQGDVGIGTQGPQGIIGVQGTQGVQGSRGIDGIIGINGVQGPQGLVGKGFVIFSYINSFNDIASVSASSSNIGEFVLVKGGDLYVYYGNNAGTTGPNNSYSYAGDITDESKLNGLQGYQGSVGNGFQGYQGSVGNGFQGSIGSAGFQGVQGTRGSDGFQGVQGSQGPVGITTINNVLNKYIDTTKNVNIINLTGAYGSWVSTIGGISTETGQGIAIDTLGNSYVTGLYTSPATIYNSDGTTFQTLSGSGSNDAFVIKYGSTGMGTWVSRISGTSSDIGYGIAVDSLGNSYVTGQYTSPATFYNSNGTSFQTMSGSGSEEAFVVKYGSTGMGTWVSRISSTSTDIGYGIAVDSLGNSYITGQYRSLATIYNSDSSAFQTMSGSGNSEAFVVKYGSTGMGTWVSKISGAFTEVGYGIAVDSLGNSYVTGQYTTRATVYNSDGTAFQTISGSNQEAFVIKYGSTGMGTWVSRISSTTPSGIAVDNLGNIYVTGQYNTQATVYNSDGTSFQTINGSANTDSLIVKYSSSGIGTWVSRISTTVCRGIVVDNSGNSYVTGEYRSPGATVYNSDGTTNQTIIGSSTTTTDAIIVKFGSTGMASWSCKINGTSNENNYGIAVDSSGNSYVTGRYGSSLATIYNADATVFRNLNNIGNADAFVLKLNDGPDSISSYNLVDLDNNSSNDGKTVYIANKVYQASFVLNLQTQSLVTYSTINVTTSISLIFFEGSWIVISQS